jgi:hypothetical protein
VTAALTGRTTSDLTAYCRDLKTATDKAVDEWQAWLDQTHGAALHRKLNAEGLSGFDAERVIRMVRREIADSLQAALSLSQQVRATEDAVAVLMDDVNRARRLAGRSGTSSVPFGRQA